MSSQPIPDSQVEVFPNSLWIYRQSWNGKPTPYCYARIVLPDYVESRSHRNQAILKSAKKTDRTEAEIWARERVTTEFQRFAKLSFASQIRVDITEVEL